MILYERRLSVPKNCESSDLLCYLRDSVLERLSPTEIPVRFVITKEDKCNYSCEIGVLADVGMHAAPGRKHIFDFQKREIENTSEFNVVLLIPTGIGAEIGGHSGDAGPVARLIASACDNLITHPNVVNAADINELPQNGIYVEGSVITRLMMGTIGLQRVKSNRVLVVLDKHLEPFLHEEAVNSVSAARATMGLDCPAVVLMDPSISMHSLYSPSGRAVGVVERLELLCNVLTKRRAEYDAVALSSVITVPEEYHLDYFKRDDLVNPWGGVEAMLTHTISSIFNIPSAHAPMAESRKLLDLDVGVVEPRKAAEAVTTTSLHCILKGLHKAPRIVADPSMVDHPNLITANDVSCLVIPDGCVGLPTLAAIEQGISVIAVRENRNRMQNRLEDLPFATGQLYIVENYLEAVGVVQAMKAGVTIESIRRPMSNTKIVATTETEVIESAGSCPSSDKETEANKSADKKSA